MIRRCSKHLHFSIWPNRFVRGGQSSLVESVRWSSSHEQRTSASDGDDSTTRNALPSSTSSQTLTEGGDDYNLEEDVDLFTMQQQQEQLKSSAAALDSNSMSSSLSSVLVEHARRPTAEVLEPLRHRVKQVIQGLTLSPHSEEIRELLRNAKTNREVRQVVDQFILTHPFASDVLNGHGFRVATVVALTSVAPKTSAINEWFDVVERFRQFGFAVTRPHASEGSSMIKGWIQRRFQVDGRSPKMVTEAIDRIRQLLQWCIDDRVVFDHVLLARFISSAVQLVSYFDRQNVYRLNFAEAFTKRDAIVQEWALCRERAVDYDRCVELCDALVAEVLEASRRYLPNVRLPFSFTYRLFDYYFASDNVEKMLELLAACERDGMVVAEAVTAKVMQLVCTFNYPNATEIFLRWRVANPQSALATADATRLLFYYGRAGGGYSCPKCGEKFNHRNPSLAVWKSTPREQRDCEYANLARTRRGEFDDLKDTPQGQDWSLEAFNIWNLCHERGIRWSSNEWRNFLCCLMNSPTPKALAGLELLDQNLTVDHFDDFLYATYCKMLRFHRPESIVTKLEEWRGLGSRFTPIVLQEALIAAAHVEEQKARIAAMRYCFDRISSVDSYITAYTRRVVDRVTDKRGLWKRQEQQQDQQQLTKDDREEVRIIAQISDLQPVVLGRLESKDSIWDLMPVRQRKNVYVAQGGFVPPPKHQGSKRNSPIGRH